MRLALSLLFAANLIMVIPACYKTIGDASLPQSNNPTPPVTIWIHGTCPPLPDKISVCVKGRPGLHHYLELKPHRVYRIAQRIIKSDPVQFDATEFYLFGWSGKLSFAEREKTAQELYQAIQTIRNRYKTRYHAEPKITIATHSHGGNVTLNLVNVKDKSDDLIIERLILLACPVQEKTKQLAHDPCFKKVYALYSDTDMIQVLDPQGLKNRDTPQCPLFSGRQFTASNTCTNVKITYPHRGLLHLDFIFPQLLTHLGPLIHEIDAWESEHCGDTPWHKAQKHICIDSKKHSFSKKLLQ